MSSHVRHEDIEVGGLADGCPRCAEIARDPLASLDDPSLSSLWARMVGFEYLGDDGCRPRSDAEAEAARVLHGAARVMRKAGISTRGLRRLFDGASLYAIDGQERDVILRATEMSSLRREAVESVRNALSP